MDRKLYRYQYWSVEGGGLLTDYAWISSIETAVQEIFGIDAEEKIYKLSKASLHEIDAYHAGYSEGHDVGKLAERIARDDGTRYTVDAPIVEEEAEEIEFTFTEKFICGVCNRHREVDDKSGKVVYVGLYGTEWQVCVYCDKDGGFCDV
jgi:hypothetical protein